MQALLQKLWSDNVDDECADPGHDAGSSADPRNEIPPPHRASAPEFRFGACRLVPGARLLLRDGRVVDIGSRAFDLLHLLLIHRGTIVPKEAIVAFVWPNIFVDESNLRFQMSVLRKALGEGRDLIKTIPGRGYIFVDEFRAEQPTPRLSAQARR